MTHKIRAFCLVLSDWKTFFIISCVFWFSSFFFSERWRLLCFNLKKIFFTISVNNCAIICAFAQLLLMTGFKLIAKRFFEKINPWLSLSHIPTSNYPQRLLCVDETSGRPKQRANTSSSRQNQRLHRFLARHDTTKDFRFHTCSWKDFIL